MLQSPDPSCRHSCRADCTGWQAMQHGSGDRRHGILAGLSAADLPLILKQPSASVKPAAEKIPEICDAHRVDAGHFNISPQFKRAVYHPR